MSDQINLKALKLLSDRATRTIDKLQKDLADLRSFCGQIDALIEQSTGPIPFDNRDLDGVCLSVRTTNALYNSGLKNADQLSRCRDSDLMQLPNFGKKCLAEVREAVGPERDPHMRLVKGIKQYVFIEPNEPMPDYFRGVLDPDNLPIRHLDLANHTLLILKAAGGLSTISDLKAEQLAKKLQWVPNLGAAGRDEIRLALERWEAAKVAQNGLDLAAVD